MKRIVQLFVLVLVLAVVPALLPPYYVTLLNYIGISALVAVGLVLLTGVGGLTSFGQAAFVGVGAYTTAVLTTSTSLPGWIAWAGASPWLALADCRPPLFSRLPSTSFTITLVAAWGPALRTVRV